MEQRNYSPCHNEFVATPGQLGARTAYSLRFRNIRIATFHGKDIWVATSPQ